MWFTEYCTESDRMVVSVSAVYLVPAWLTRSWGLLPLPSITGEYRTTYPWPGEEIKIQSTVSPECLSRSIIKSKSRKSGTVCTEHLPPVHTTHESWILSNVLVLNLVRCHNHMTSACKVNVGMGTRAAFLGSWSNSAPAYARWACSHFYQRHGSLHLAV